MVSHLVQPVQRAGGAGPGGDQIIIVFNFIGRNIIATENSGIIIQLLLLVPPLCGTQVQ